MANQQGAKGRKWEKDLLEPLRLVFGPQVMRSPPTTPSMDFVGTLDVRIEAKKVDVPKWKQWVLHMRRYAKHHRWCIVWSGDRRLREIGPPVAIVDLKFLWELLYSYQLVTTGGWHVGDTTVSAAIFTPREVGEENVEDVEMRVVQPDDGSAAAVLEGADTRTERETVPVGGFGGNPAEHYIPVPTPELRAG